MDKFILTGLHNQKYSRGDSLMLHAAPFRKSVYSRRYPKIPPAKSATEAVLLVDSFCFGSLVPQHKTQSRINWKRDSSQVHWIKYSAEVAVVLCYAIQPAVHPVTELAAKAGAQSKSEEVVQWYHPEKGREYELIPDPLHKLVHRS